MPAVTWYLRYPLSYRDLESRFLERGFEVVKQRSKLTSWSCHFLSLFEAPRVVSGLDNIAMMGDAIEEGCSHFGVAEDADPFGKA